MNVLTRERKSSCCTQPGAFSFASEYIDSKSVLSYACLDKHNKQDNNKMTLVTAGWEMVVELVDRGNKSTSRTYELTAVDDAGDIADVVTAATEIRTRLLLVTDLKIKSYRLAQVFLENAFTLPTVATAEREQHARITAQILGIPNKSAIIDIPGPKDTVFLATAGDDADRVNFSADPVLDYVKIFGTDDLATISDGEVIDANIHKGIRTHSRSNS